VRVRPHGDNDVKDTSMFEVIHDCIHTRVSNFRHTVLGMLNVRLPSSSSGQYGVLTHRLHDAAVTANKRHPFRLSAHPWFDVSQKVLAVYLAHNSGYTM
jgi:hypothetical protein